MTSATHPHLRRTDNILLIAIAAATIIVHLLTGSRYGFHRDELQLLDDARHIDWGFVAYPPVTPLFARISLALFGTSLVGFRFFAMLTEALAVVIAGLMARELGGRRGAQLLTAAAAVPFCLVGGSVMQYVSFDYLAWVCTAYFIIKLLRTDDPRWWLAISASIAFGFLSKYGMAFFVIAIVLGTALTDARKYFKSKWLYLGIALCVVVCLPNVIWQAKHHFISLDFLKEIHARDIRWGRTKNFLPEQLQFTLFATPLALAGLYFYFFSPQGKRFRMLGWMYIIPLVEFIVLKGRGYYLAGAYPMLFAAGAVSGEQWLGTLREHWKIATMRALAWTAIAANIAVFAAILLPIAPIGSRWFQFNSKIQGDFVEELGWPELTETVAKVRDSLPAAHRAHLGIIAGNYGEAGALNLYGPQYQLPNAISGINSFWLRGYGDPPPQTVITVGLSRRFVERNFTQCELAAHTWNRYGVLNEETKDHPDIFVCRGLKQSWQDFWKDFRYFG